MSPIFILYGGVAVAVFAAFILGRGLDKKHSNDHVTWKTGCIGPKTAIQAVVLGLIGGPIVYAMKGGTEDLLFCILCMAAAPFVVDLLKPTVTLHNEQEVPPKFAMGINKANYVAIVVGVLIVSGICYLIANAPERSQANNQSLECRNR